MASYIDAVFAYFGDDEPNPELQLVLFQRIEPTDEELEEILTSNDGSDEGKTYCQRVHDALLGFCADPEAFAFGLSDDNKRKSDLREIAVCNTVKVAIPQEPIVKHEPVAKPAVAPEVAVEKVDPMLSGMARVAQPPRTTPIRRTEQPAAEDGDAMKRERGDRLQRGHTDDGQRRPRFILSNEQTIEFHSDPQGFIDKFPVGSHERLSLEQILEEVKKRKSASEIDPITREMREATKGKQWKGIYEALLNAFLLDDNEKKVLAGQLRDSYLRGIYGVNGRVLGALMKQCMLDLDTKLNVTDPDKFIRRYVG